VLANNQLYRAEVSTFFYFMLANPPCNKMCGFAINLYDLETAATELSHLLDRQA
jgi:hypothetical protein